MKDYTNAPTSEFQLRKDTEYLGGRGSGIMGWLTLQKAVMNDYYFDAHDTEWILSDLDNFMHKMYYCWQEAMRIHVEQIEGGLTE